MDTWGPRYGVLPGYGYTMQNGFEDVFVSIASAALEMGAMRYAKGFIDNEFSNYVRDDGLVDYRANEVSQQARFLTILATYSYYARGEETEEDTNTFLIKHFPRAKALADWLLARRRISQKLPASDPRRGLIFGLDEGDNFVHFYYHQSQPVHFFSHLAEAYRAFAEIGPVWAELGEKTSRPDITAHGNLLLKEAPGMIRDLHISMNKTVNLTSSPGHRC